MTRLELLAPARTADIGIAAIRCGADAVYIGGPAFGARAAASNSVEDIARLCREAAPFGVRIFVTVNTLASDDRERMEIVRSIEAMRGIGVAAFIIQDLTLMPLLHSELASGESWQEEFHASTQCAIRTPERARFVASLGFTRLILERQLSLEQIRAIRAAVPPEVQLECFVHGALCVCYSGDCYLSEALTGRSANRGECSQPCRSLYDLCYSRGKDGSVLVRDTPLLSLRDLCLIDRLEELAEAGVCSFKIEGRLKNEAYVKNVTRAYSMELDKLVARRPDLWQRTSLGRCTGGFTPDVNKTFNRGYTTLFLDGRRGQWDSGDSAKGMGEYVGSIDNLLCELHNGDGLSYVKEGGRPEVVGGRCEVVGGRPEVVGFRVDKVERGRDGRQIITAWTADGVPGSKVHGRGVGNNGLPGPGVKLWRNLDVAFLKELENNMPRRSIEVPVKLIFGNRTMRLEVVGNCPVAAEIELGNCPVAENQERMKALAFNQISKSTGCYDFVLEGIVCGGGDGGGGDGGGGDSGESRWGRLPLVSAKMLNELRRELAEKLEEKAVSIVSDRSQLTGDDAGLTPTVQHGLVHPVQPGELMRTKYCIRYRLGMCTKMASVGQFLPGVGHKGFGQSAPKIANVPKGAKLFLRNNGRCIPLDFDCANCEMIVCSQ